MGPLQIWRAHVLIYLRNFCRGIRYLAVLQRFRSTHPLTRLMTSQVKVCGNISIKSRCHFRPLVCCTTMSSYSVKRLFRITCYFLSIVLTTDACEGSAEYKLTFKAEWTKQSHPVDFPPFQTFSTLVGCSHKASYVMWKPGMNATTGVEDVAENGKPIIISVH